MTPEQVAALLAECRGWLHTFVVIALNTGLRVSEVLSLTWEDVDFEKSVIKVRNDGDFTTKSGENREVPVNAFLDSVLKKAPRGIADPHIILTSKGTRPDRRLVYKHFKRALPQAGLPGSFRIHDMRHTFGTTLAAKGEDVRTIQELMGHKDLKTTMIYLHAAPNRMRAAVENLGLDGSKPTEPVTIWSQRKRG